jgi:segregation and condensation protein B
MEEKDVQNQKDDDLIHDDFSDESDSESSEESVMSADDDVDDESSKDSEAEDISGDTSEEDGSDDSSGEEVDDVERDELELKGLFESVLFLTNEPLSSSFFVKNFSVDPTQAKIVMDSLVDEYEERDGGILLVEIANGFQFVTNARYAEQLRHALGMKRRETLSKGMLETLAIVSYKQPIVLAEIDDLRGVSSRMMVANLMKRNLIKPVGRMNLPGRPLAYGTTDEFLRFFGLNRLSDLPKLSEIKEFSLDSEE